MVRFDKGALKTSLTLQLTIGDAAGKEVAGFPPRQSLIRQVVLCSPAADNNMCLENGCCSASLVPEKQKSCEVNCFKDLSVLCPAGLAGERSE